MIKLLSGRFIFTIVAALVFAYCAIKGILAPDKIYDILQVVIVAYFVKGAAQSNNGGK
jgi:hypothetical protein